MIRIFTLLFFLVGCSSTEDFNTDIQLSRNMEYCYTINREFYEPAFSSDFVYLNCYSRLP